MTNFSVVSQCSVPCGYGIQSRAVSCMGPTKPEPLSPLLCMHMPKPITIRGCQMDDCRVLEKTSALTNTHTTNTPSLETRDQLPSPQGMEVTPMDEEPLLSPTLSLTQTPPTATEPTTPQTTTAMPTVTPKTSKVAELSASLALIRKGIDQALGELHQLM